MSLSWLVLIACMAANTYANVYNADTAPLPIPFAVTPSTMPLATPPVAESDVHLLAATTWAEARSEGELGMRAVAHVVLNRVGSPRFGDSLSEVILHPRQFSAWNLKDPNRPLALDPERYATGGVNLATWETAQNVARAALEHRSADPTNGALFYHTTKVRPSWAKDGIGRQIIGHHVFYADVAPRSRA